MIHGIGAETGTQVLLIAAVGGAASAGLGIPMLLAFVARPADLELRDRRHDVGRVRGQPDPRADLRRGRPVAGLFSLVIGTIYVLVVDGLSWPWTAVAVEADVRRPSACRSCRPGRGR